MPSETEIWRKCNIENCERSVGAELMCIEHLTESLSYEWNAALAEAQKAELDESEVGRMIGKVFGDLLVVDWNTEELEALRRFILRVVERRDQQWREMLEMLKK